MQPAISRDISCNNYVIPILNYETETPKVGGRGMGHVPHVLGYQLTLFGPRGADYALHITTDPPSFWTMRHFCEIFRENIGS